MGAIIRRIRPAQGVALGFLAAIAVGTVLLALPICREGPGGAPVGTALFTATSAVTITGLSVVDTATYWTPGGQVVIMVLMQVGGLGVMSATALLFLLVSRRLSMRSRLLAQAETSVQGPGEVRRVLLAVAGLTLVVESVAALLLAVRFWIGGDSLPTSLWYGSFHAVAAFNNAGFSLFSDNLVGYAGDAWVCGVIALAIIIGGLGIPVLADLVRRPRAPRRWTMHTKLTLVTTAALIVFGAAAVLIFEWGNSRTLGALDVQGRLVAGVFQGITPRTAGFNSVNYGDMREETLMVTDFLMLVGTGSVSTGGGIKVTTLCVLVLAAVAATRGSQNVQVFGRRIPEVSQRQALAITVLATGAVAVSTLALVAMTDLGLSPLLFEAISAIGTAGLSTGITGGLPGAAQGVLIVLMIIGRVGPQVLGAALVLRERERRFTYPEERPIVG